MVVAIIYISCTERKQTQGGDKYPSDITGKHAFMLLNEKKGKNEMKGKNEREGKQDEVYRFISFFHFISIFRMEATNANDPPHRVPVRHVTDL